MTKRFAAIAPVLTETAPIKGLKGIRVRAQAALSEGQSVVRAEIGEVLFTDYGLSGICIMQLARAVHGLARPVIALNLAPEMGEGAFFERARLLEARRLEDFLCGIVPRRVGERVLEYAGLAAGDARVGDVSRRTLDGVYKALTRFRLRVRGVCGFESAQVTAGGVDMAQFDDITLESRRMPGMYVAGEICDVDGDCGGYNLNWAWASAICVARAILNGA